MKRCLTMILGGLLIVAMASPLFAQEIKVTGQIRTRLRYWVDLDLDSDLKGNGGQTDRRYFDNRTRFGVDAKLAEGVRARIELEKYFDFGNVSPNGLTSAQQSGQSPQATLSETSADVYVRQAWIDFQIPGLPEGWRLHAGRSGHALGHQQVWGNSITGEDGFNLYGPIGPGTFRGRFAQTMNLSPAQGGRQRFWDNELNHWSVDYKADVAQNHNVQLYVIGQNDRAVDDFTSTVTNSGGSLVRRGNEYWFGGAYSGLVGPVALKLEGTYQFGTAREEACLTAAGGPALSGATCVVPGQSIGRSAGFVYLQGDYKLVPAYTTGLNFSWASGDDDPNDDSFNNFVGVLSGPPAAISRLWSDSQFFYGNRTGRRMGNTTTNRLFNFWGKGTEDIDATASTDNSGNLFSPGLFLVKWTNKYVASSQVTLKGDLAFMWATHDRASISVAGPESKYVGGEIDLVAAYKPYKNLLINGYFGYFWPGDFFRTTSVPNRRNSAWLFRTEFIVTF